jgi:predicted RNase H-like nuclease
VRVVAGVDGRRGGWALALASLDPRGRLAGVRWSTVPGQDAAGVAAVLRLAAEAGAEAVGVDAPIGLPRDSWRVCDLLAKRRLGAASARVFLAPPREVLAAPTYGDARNVARARLGGRSVSAQTYGLRRVVLALDDALRHPPAELAGIAARVVEVHPELSFMAMAGRASRDPMPSKRTPIGATLREQALASWLADPATGLAAPDGDDHLDALAAAWSASRWADGAAEVLGGEPDEHGIPMRIAV